MIEEIEAMHAWAAGFIDGEGYLDISRRHGGRSHTPCIIVYQVEKEPLERLVALYGGHLYAVPKRGNNKPAFRWQIASASKIKEILPLMIPYMTVKYRQALLLQEFCELVGPRGTHMTKEQAARREELFNLIRDERK